MTLLEVLLLLRIVAFSSMMCVYACYRSFRFGEFFAGRGFLVRVSCKLLCGGTNSVVPEVLCSGLVFVRYCWSVMIRGRLTKRELGVGSWLPAVFFDGRPGCWGCFNVLACTGRGAMFVSLYMCVLVRVFWTD